MKNPENYNILVVDDEEALRDTLKSHLELDGYNLFVAGSGNEAIDIVSKNKIDFIITDVQMPDGTGEELLEKVRSLNPELPVILMVTGFAHISREDAVNKGAVDLLAKPIDLDLVEKIILENLNNSVSSE